MKRIIRGINKRNIITTSIIVLIFVMSLGYAALSQHMDLDGIATIDRSWIVKIKSMNCTTTGTAKVDSTNFISNTAVINGTLGDSSSKITCTIVLENQGNLKAKLGNVEVIEDDNKLITYSYTGVSEGTQLNPGESNTVTVTINYASGVTNIENTKKSVMLTFVYLENEPNTSNNPSPVPTSYEEYKVGDEVTLLDGSKWTVTKASGKDEGLVTLLSKALLTSSGEYTTDSTKAYKVAFGSGATEYDTFTSGNIGYFIDNTYLPKAKAALNAAGGTTINTKARLLTTDEYNALYSTPKGFATDSWDTIAKNIDSDAYQVGDTRKVTLEGFGTFTLRLANKSTPDACKDTENFSQTACGFVVEFADIITTHNMNSTATNSGGWESSDLRAYLNKDIYEALPEDLKAVIIDTNVISGHGSGDSSNFKTKDKLYLLAPHEVWADANLDYADDLTRQLDYYEKNNVNTSNYSGAKKYKPGSGSASYWWLRAVRFNSTGNFYMVSGSGSWSHNNANIAEGVSPAFRIWHVEYGSIWGMTKCSSGFMSYSVEDIETSSSCSAPTTTEYIRPVIITEKSNVVLKPESFATDSWETIKENTNRYQVGYTRKVTLEGFGTFTLRIANTSTPDVCKDTENFSQTACGFVVEFADIITTHNMNSTATNSGGWESSDLRAYLNKDIYEALPEDLKAVIIDTNVISGHGSGDSSNFKTKDKLYLLAPHEVWADANLDYADDLTRQLDYYEKNNVNTSNYSGAKKYKPGSGSASYWWLRAVRFNSTGNFYMVSGSGSWSHNNANIAEGVSPAFRIG